MHNVKDMSEREFLQKLRDLYLQGGKEKEIDEAIKERIFQRIGFIV